MDNLTKELVESKRDFGMFWVAEWHKSGTSTHTHLLLKGEVTDLWITIGKVITMETIEVLSI